MEMVFHVFVDGVTATTSNAVRALAHAISAHYGVGADDVYARLMRGPFRVKTNVDEATAHMYARDLTAIGARVRIEPVEAPVVSARPTRAGLSALAELPPAEAVDAPTVGGRPTKSGLGVLATTPPPRTTTKPALPPQPGPRPTRSGLTPQTAVRATRPGLSAPPAATAAPRTTTPALAIAGPRATEAEDIALALSALDGGDVALALVDNAPPPARSAHPTNGPSAFAPPGNAFAPPGNAFAPPGNAFAAPASAKPVDLPVDLFAPPEAALADELVELAPDELAYRESKRQHSGLTDVSALAKSSAKWPQSPPRTSPQIVAAASAKWPQSPPRTSPQIAAPAVSRTVSASSPSLRVAAQAATAAAVPPPAQSASLPAAPARRYVKPRVRFAVGVALAVVLGFVPADLIASWRERDAFHAIDAHVNEVQAAADTPPAYAALDAFRADQLAAKRSARRLSVLTTLLVWAAAGGALGYVWFRRVRWPEAPEDAAA